MQEQPPDCKDELQATDEHTPISIVMVTADQAQEMSHQIQSPQNHGEVEVSQAEEVCFLIILSITILNFQLFILFLLLFVKLSYLTLLFKSFVLDSTRASAWKSYLDNSR